MRKTEEEKSKETVSDPLQAVLDALKTQAGEDGKRALPPVHLWNPEHCGDIGMEIRKDGSWWHDGGIIGRQKIVRLFSTILRKDDDGIYLVTPHEKVIVHVEDAPFIAVRIDRKMIEGEQNLVVTTNVGDIFVIDANHPLRVSMDAETGEPSPYVEVRHGLEAKVARAPFYELVEWSEPLDDAANIIGVKSAGEIFELGSVKSE
ncbi:DUF1285 domain-containing protein [Hirschia baltica]|uniref:DUF1285 domain-containing protein n=1 Tax=Hirschia baltica (strain ATCC 49814 / DSM 5838 / IFAM 1418) TaxID=582402 RepID=C6XPE3_HIRBI|nr:DUF1285 domain-containing protein [Hirschia baltica]ACT58429.1 protein of unknown function DUF1285 [Hirschia baltica ATCC 49814]